MGFRFERHQDAAAFLARAGPWLLRSEAEHNLVLGIAHALVQGRGGYQEPFLFATVETDGSVVGCVFRTPPWKLGLTRLPSATIPLVVESVARVYDELPAVLGPEPETAGFAHLWAQRRGTRAQPGQRQRIYQVERVIPPARPAPGRLRLAQQADLSLVREWIHAFAIEAAMREVHAGDVAANRIAAHAMFLWEDPEPVSMVGWTGRSPNGLRIGPVYTPPERRGRGYASAAVAAVTQRALDSGVRFCFLYTDLANPTSNAIYQRLGYEAVCDVADWLFDEPAVTSSAQR